MKVMDDFLVSWGTRFDKFIIPASDKAMEWAVKDKDFNKHYARHQGVYFLREKWRIGPMHEATIKTINNLGMGVGLIS